MQKDEGPDLVKGLVAGVAGGLLAALVMEQFQALWNNASAKIQESSGVKQTKSRAKPATVKAADEISERVFGKKVPRRGQRLAGEAMHYAMGATSGAIYGLAAEHLPASALGEGLPFGTAVWIIADEISVPALGLTKPALKVAFSTHVYAFGSHLVYGWVTEIVRRAIRRAL